MFRVRIKIKSSRCVRMNCAIQNLAPLAADYSELIGLLGTYQFIDKEQEK